MGKGAMNIHSSTHSPDILFSSPAKMISDQKIGAHDASSVWDRGFLPETADETFDSFFHFDYHGGHSPSLRNEPQLDVMSQVTAVLPKTEETILTLPTTPPPGSLQTYTDIECDTAIPSIEKDYDNFEGETKMKADKDDEDDDDDSDTISRTTEDIEHEILKLAQCELFAPAFETYLDEQVPSLSSGEENPTVHAFVKMEDVEQGHTEMGITIPSNFSEKELLRFEGITLHSPKKSPQSVASNNANAWCNIDNNGEIGTDSIHMEVDFVDHESGSGRGRWPPTGGKFLPGQNPALHGEAPTLSPTKINKDKRRLDPSTIIATGDNSSGTRRTVHPPVQHVTFVRGQLEDPFLDSLPNEHTESASLANSAPRNPITGHENNQATGSTSSPPMHYAPEIKRFSTVQRTAPLRTNNHPVAEQQYLQQQSNDMGEWLDPMLAQNLTMSSNHAETSDEQDNEWNASEFSVLQTNDYGLLPAAAMHAVNNARSAARNLRTVGPIAVPGTTQEQQNHCLQNAMSSYPSGFTIPPKAQMHGLIPMASQPPGSITNPSEPTYGRRGSIVPPLLQMPQPRRPPNRQDFVNNLAVHESRLHEHQLQQQYNQAHQHRLQAYQHEPFYQPPTHVPQPALHADVHMQLSSQMSLNASHGYISQPPSQYHSQMVATVPSPRRTRTRPPSTRDRYVRGAAIGGMSSTCTASGSGYGMFSSPSTIVTGGMTSTLGGSSRTLRRISSSSLFTPHACTSLSGGSPNKQVTRSTSLGTLSGSATRGILSPMGGGSGGGRVLRKRGSSRGIKVAPDLFVNLTVNDSAKLMSGVAPSGSSKTKMKREKQIAEEKRLIVEQTAEEERARARVAMEKAGVKASRLEI